MKKLIFVAILVLSVSLCGCTSMLSIVSGKNIETLNSWSIQYNEGTNDYSIFFGLKNKSGRFISADVDVDIRIINDKDEEVFKGSKSVTKNDFGNYTSKNDGEQYLAEIRIPATEFAEGKSSSGTVYLKVYKENVVSFDEVNCKALYCLLTKDIKFTTSPLPVVINVKSYNGKIESKIKIEKVAYKFEKEISPKLNITINGLKTYGNSKTAIDMISYKLYDSEGYVVESGNIFLSSLGKGDKFNDDSIVIYDITPGESYTLKFFEYSM